MLSRKAQSTLEYIIVLAAIVGVIVWGAKTYIYPAVKWGYIGNTREAITKAADRF